MEAWIERGKGKVMEPFPKGGYLLGFLDPGVVSLKFNVLMQSAKRSLGRLKNNRAFM